MFISGLSDTDVISQALASGIVANAITLAAGMRTYGGVGGVIARAVIASRAHLILRPILASAVTNVVDNQIRRLIGHRRHKRHVS
jgi:hypothetical protein